jgi:hypothetical protein
MPYTPTLKLPESPKTIEANAQLEPFVSKIPPPDADSKGGDREVISAGSMEGDLAEQIQHAILTDFRVNSVFRSVRIYEDQPDLLIRGVIYQFAEHRSQPWYAHVPLVRVFLGTRDQVEGSVHLELMLSTSTGHPVGTYQGRSMFPDANQSGIEKEGETATSRCSAQRCLHGGRAPDSGTDVSRSGTHQRPVSSGEG